MAATYRAAYYPLIVPRYGTFRLPIKLPWDCTTKTLLAQIYDVRKKNKVADIVVEERNAATGEFDLVLEHTVTATLPENGEWDLLLIDEVDDERFYPLYGPMKLDLRVTQEPAVTP